MKNITLSADEHLIALARQRAQEQKTTLNAMFREWLEEFARRDEARKKADEVMKNLSEHLSFDRKFSRDELNER